MLSDLLIVIPVISCNPPIKHGALRESSQNHLTPWTLVKYFSQALVALSRGQTDAVTPWLDVGSPQDVYTQPESQSKDPARISQCCSLCCFVEVCTSEDLINYRAQLCPAATWCIREQIWRCRPAWHIVWSYELFMHLAGWKGLNIKITEF